MKYIDAVSMVIPSLNIIVNTFFKGIGISNEIEILSIQTETTSYIFNIGYFSIVSTEPIYNIHSVDFNDEGD